MVKKKAKADRKEGLEKIGRRLEKIGEELEGIEKDLSESRLADEEESIVEGDMRERQKQLQARGYKVQEEERSQPEYKGVKLYYRKFVSRLEKALK
ncbi:MAG: hypothetical protein V1703_02165 [Candidatus Altiarchaeota archaeon]